jgi:hypothetical protein
MTQYGGSHDKPDAAALSGVTDLWRRIRALRRRPERERAALFDQLGVSHHDQGRIEALLAGLEYFTVYQPGQFFTDGDCPLGWQPSVLAPAFHGFSDFGPVNGLPYRVRVFYPSVDGTPLDASIIGRCGRTAEGQ